MADAPATTKRALIDKTNKNVVIITGIAAFVTIFCLVAAKGLFGQAMYQNHVLSAEHQALSQIKSDITAAKQLKQSYQQFTTTSKAPADCTDANNKSGTTPVTTGVPSIDPAEVLNIICGNVSGSGPRDGSNDTLVLHALPDSYDFPALTSTIEKLVTNINGLTFDSITGSDDEVNQSSNTASNSPQPVAMPFQLAVTGKYSQIQQLISEFEHSIRPFQIQTLSLSGDQDNLTLTMTAQTFYQPAKTLNFKTEVVK